LLVGIATSTYFDHVLYYDAVGDALGSEGKEIRNWASAFLAIITIVSSISQIQRFRLPSRVGASLLPQQSNRLL
jgi:hypothetical protein